MSRPAALPPGLAAALPDFAGPSVLLAFDFDGTLAPLVAEPARASLPEATRARLARLAERRRVAVLSGRALADVAGRLAGLPLAAIAGNHGAERQLAGAAPGADAPRAAVAPDGLVPAPGAPAGPDPGLLAVAAWGEQLRAALAAFAGVQVEDKRLSLAVHYRLAERPEEARRAIEAAAAALPGARVFGGHAIVNVVCPGKPHKGDALVALVAELGCNAALYVGDDRTDEDAFGAAGRLRLLGVRIGPAPGTAAAHVLPSREAVDPLLDALLELAR